MTWASSNFGSQPGSRSEPYAQLVRVITRIVFALAPKRTFDGGSLASFLAYRDLVYIK